MREITNTAQLALNTASITSWWALHPSLKDRYTSSELEALLGMSMRSAAAALCLLGWRREKVWFREQSRRKLRTYWVPPEKSYVRPPRGRPRFSLANLLRT